MDIFPGLEGLDHDHAGGVLGDHGVIVTAPCFGCKLLCVVGVEIGLVHGLYVEVIANIAW